ncbi:MAG: Rrf2 family transcriptional regulator [Sideroxydans sp.]
MQINLSTDIALRTLIYLGQKGAPATIAEIAQSFDIAKTHLMKVAMALVAENLVISERGRNGGIRLAREAHEIRVGEVVKLMENSLALVFCMKEGTSDDDCPLLPSCRLRKLFFKAQKSFLASLDESTLADLLPVNITPQK